MVKGRGNGQLNVPWGVAVDSKEIVIAENWSHRIKLVDTGGNYGSPNDWVVIRRITFTN